MKLSVFSALALFAACATTPDRPAPVVASGSSDDALPYADVERVAMARPTPTPWPAHFPRRGVIPFPVALRDLLCDGDVETWALLEDAARRADGEDPWDPLAITDGFDFFLGHCHTPEVCARAARTCSGLRHIEARERLLEWLARCPKAPEVEAEFQRADVSDALRLDRLYLREEAPGPAKVHLSEVEVALLRRLARPGVPPRLRMIGQILTEDDRLSSLETLLELAADPRLRGDLLLAFKLPEGLRRDARARGLVEAFIADNALGERVLRDLKQASTPWPLPSPARLTESYARGRTRVEELLTYPRRPDLVGHLTSCVVDPTAKHPDACLDALVWVAPDVAQALAREQLDGGRLPAGRRYALELLSRYRTYEALDAALREVGLIPEDATADEAWLAARTWERATRPPGAGIAVEPLLSSVGRLEVVGRANERLNLDPDFPYEALLPRLARLVEPTLDGVRFVQEPISDVGIVVHAYMDGERFTLVARGIGYDDALTMAGLLNVLLRARGAETRFVSLESSAGYVLLAAEPRVIARAEARGLILREQRALP